MAFPLIAAIIPIIGGIIDRIIPDKAAAAKAKAELLTMELKGDLDIAVKQLEVNTQEAKHSSVFVAAWRPCVGWICAAAFGYHYLVYPILLTTASLTGLDVTQLPVFDMSALLTVLGGLLGLGGLRTFEKYKGIVGKH